MDGFPQHALFYHSETEKIRRESENFGIYVCGTSVQHKNAADVLGDGTVSYDPGGNMLMLNNATLESDGSTVIFAEKDLTIVLNGENKLICTGAGSVAGLYASDYMLRKDISIISSGTLTVEKGGNADAAVGGIVAKDVWAYSDITVDLTGVAEGSSGIGLLCHSVFFDYGATVNCEIDAIDGVRHVTE